MTFVYFKSMLHYLRGLRLDYSNDPEACVRIDGSIKAIEDAIGAMQ